MKFEEYIQLVSRKIGPNAAFDLARDAQLKAFEKLLVEKGIATKEEIEAEQETQFGETAQNILRMPPLPQQANDQNATQSEPNAN